MPDRAVVNDKEYGFFIEVSVEAPTDTDAMSLAYHTVKHPIANEDGIALIGIYHSEFVEKKPTPDSPIPPRALVAISEGGQWLVVMEELDGQDQWCQYRHASSWSPISWLFQGCVPDTGQDAHEVLREWIERKGG